MNTESRNQSSMHIDKMSTKDWGFVILENDKANSSHTFMNQHGHSVDWEFYINTAKITNVAEVDKSFRIIAKDAKGNNISSTAPASKPSSTTTMYTAEAYGQNSEAYKTINVPEYRMDVVPYITKIETKERQSSKSCKASINLGYLSFRRKYCFI